MQETRPMSARARGPTGSHAPQEGAVGRAEFGFCSRGDPAARRSARGAPDVLAQAGPPRLESTIRAPSRSLF